MKSISPIFLLMLLFISTSFFGQEASNENWKAHFAYSDFVDIAVSEDNIYVAASNSIFAHNVFTNTNKEYTTVEGLSGEEITAIHYSENHSTIIIGYKNGLVELINERNGNVSSLVDISSQSAFSVVNIKINNFFEEDDILYIATGFGIVEYNLSTGFFGDTFLISDSSAVISDVLAVGILGDTIFASINDRGIFSANKNDQNLITESNWTNIQSNIFVDMQLLSDKLVAHERTTDIYNFDGSTFSSVYTNSTEIINFNVNFENEITLTDGTGTVVLNMGFSEIRSAEHDTDSDVTHSVYINNEFYFINQGIGFFKTTNLAFEETIKISPDGPELNDAYALDAFDGDLWVAYGSTSVSYNDNEPNGIRSNGVSRLRNNEWLNIPFEDINARSIESVLIDKQDKEKVYFSSFREGLVEYNEGSLTTYNHLNSNLEPVEGFDVVRVFSANFDSEGNLWVVNSRQRNALKQFSKDIGGGISVDFENFLDTVNTYFHFNFKEIIFDGDNVFIASFKNGVIGYNLNSKSIVDLKEVDLENIPNIDVKALDLDKNGELWIGTVTGLRKLSNPSSIFTSANVRAESIIFLENGIAQELLFEQSITDIKTDASNNKWIATSGGGVFYVSPDGQETIFNFTAENSPLPSNAVIDMALDDSTGTVFFATEKGLMEFNTDITVAEDDLTKLKVFPNPVRPEYENPIVTIQGLTSGANVKITDIEGNLVYEIENDTFDEGGSGSVFWDTKSFSGNKVASGVYLILITGFDGTETSIQKLLIVR